MPLSSTSLTLASICRQISKTWAKRESAKIFFLTRRRVRKKLSKGSENEQTTIWLKWYQQRQLKPRRQETPRKSEVSKVRSNSKIVVNFEFRDFHRLWKYSFRARKENQERSGCTSTYADCWNWASETAAANQREDKANNCTSPGSTEASKVANYSGNLFNWPSFTGRYEPIYPDPARKQAKAELAVVGLTAIV